MWKLIFLILIIWLAIYMIKRIIKATAGHDRANSADIRNNKPEPVENMVQCATCHVHLPRSEAYLVNGEFYCSQAHITSK